MLRSGLRFTLDALHSYNGLDEFEHQVHWFRYLDEQAYRYNNARI